MILSGLNNPMILSGLNNPMILSGLNNPMILSGPNNPTYLSGLNNPMILSGPNNPTYLSGPINPLHPLSLQCSLISDHLWYPNGLKILHGLNLILFGLNLIPSGLNLILFGPLLLLLSGIDRFHLQDLLIFKNQDELEFVMFAVQPETRGMYSRLDCMM
jgi:hypothetical protein